MCGRVVFIYKVGGWLGFCGGNLRLVGRFGVYLSWGYRVGC